jgi:hypothetical protein
MVILHAKGNNSDTIPRSLRILGLEPVASAFHEALVQNSTGVSDRSLMYWERAARRPLHLAPDEDDESAEGVDFLREWLPNEA